MAASLGKAKRILVSGVHRSGTTWLGTILAAHREAEYIHEPLNVTDGPPVIRAVARHSYTYICPKNERNFLQPLEAVFAAGCQAEECHIAHIKHTWTLVKDPFAFFSVPWFASRFGFRGVITVRRPVSFVSSLKRLNWRFDHNHLLEQPLLMRDWLEPFRGEMVAALATPDDIIGQACLLWRMVYTAAARMKQDLPQTIIVRHEDLSFDPWRGFCGLYDQLGIEADEPTDRAIDFFCNTLNPTETTIEPPHTVALNSRANLENWRKRLTPDEVARVEELTGDVVGQYYSTAELQDFAAAQQQALSQRPVASPLRRALASWVSKVLGVKDGYHVESGTIRADASRPPRIPSDPPRVV
jgi:hypothetical protein